MHTRSLALGALALVATFAASPVPARADDTIKHPGDHPTYPVEIEPHVLLGFGDLYAGSSIGLGARFSIPVVQNGFVPSINNSVAVTFGADFLHYDGCPYVNGINCGANFLLIPVAMQWNFFVAQQWSVFGEPGIYIFHGWFDSPGPACPFCGTPSATGLRPSIEIGGRYHFNQDIALTLRLGYPTFSVGVSFM